jgi:hypothetical protein
MWCELFFALSMSAVAPPIDREAFNDKAFKHGASLFWRSDDNRNERPDPEEVSVLFDAPIDKPQAILALLKQQDAAPPSLDADETERTKLLELELSQARTALVLTKTETWSEDDRAFAKKMWAVFFTLDRLYEKQLGASALSELVEGPLARSVFTRNHGPWCVMPSTEKNPRCNAIASLPPKLNAFYPSDLQQKPGFCETLAKHRHARALSQPFSVVRGEGDAFQPVPYHIVFSSEMDAVSIALREAAEALPSDEPAMKAYVLAAAQAFRDNQWAPADEAWLKTASSRFYLRVAPDETYADPCSRHAAFAAIFGRINKAPIAWQAKLEPHKQAMETLVAEMAGPPYKARHVRFDLPDFIDVIFAAGDARLPFGATIGQSLPIFGKAAAEGRKRTLAMTNLFVDKDSAQRQRQAAATVLCASALSAFTEDPEPKLVSTILHEASHNLGPMGFYQVDGKSLPQIFGAQTSLVLNELHAQSTALRFIDWLREKEVVTPELARRAHLKDIIYALEQMSRGVVTPEGKPKPYGALGAIQIHAMTKSGALTWMPKERSESGALGCLALDETKLGPAISALATNVLRIRARGDKAAADALLAAALGQAAMLDMVAERFSHFPKSTFVYALE